MATHPDLTRLRTMPSAPAARHPVYYMVHIAHELNPQHVPKPLPAHPDIQIGLYCDVQPHIAKLVTHLLTLVFECSTVVSSSTPFLPLFGAGLPLL